MVIKFYMKFNNLSYKVQSFKMCVKFLPCDYMIDLYSDFKY